jgi:N4-gp56 family major capsid protein
MKYIAEHPADGKTRVRPMDPRSNIEGSHGFVLFIDDLLARDLRADATFMQANRDARLRGTDNPVFAGANYIWNNVAIYTIPELAPFKGVGNAGIDVGRAYLCGAQAVGVAWGKKPWTVDKELDYNRYSGMAIMQWYEVEKLRWGTGTNDKDLPVDHGVVSGFFAATAYA